MKKAFKNKKINVLIADSVLLVLALLASNIAAFMIKYIPPCVFMEKGILCPACGGTRCIQSFFSGNISAAFSYNAYFTVVIFYAMVLLFLINLYCLFDFKRLKIVIRIISGKEAIVALAVGFLFFGVIRTFAQA